ncbi:MAG: hypothetical protein L0206_15165, partial [Actinobacteria bacterium]|nr:hypothetical protein [Actinomycetota bacterium]
TDTGTGSDTGPISDEFVMDSVLYAEEDVGFDLDDWVTDDPDDPIGCGHIDGPDGIDNQLGPVMLGIDDLLDINSEGLLAATVQEGVLLLLFRLVNIDDRVNDDALEMHVFNGLDFDDPEDPDNNLGGEGQFYIDPSSVEGGDESTPNVLFGGGTLTDRLFEGGPEDFELTLPLGGGVNIDVTLLDARLGFTLGQSRFTNGVVGGSVPVEDIIEAVRDTPKYTDQAGFVEILLYNQADIDLIPEGPTGTTCTVDDDCTRDQHCYETNGDPCDGAGCECWEDAEHCDALSGAVKITGIRAEIMGVAP